MTRGTANEQKKWKDEVVVHVCINQKSVGVWA